MSNITRNDQNTRNFNDMRDITHNVHNAHNAEIMTRELQVPLHAWRTTSNAPMTKPLCRSQ